jgi:hypothetical protein
MVMLYRGRREPRLEVQNRARPGVGGRRSGIVSADHQPSDPLGSNRGRFGKPLEIELRELVVSSRL